jgi:hypothetical protein
VRRQAELAPGIAEGKVRPVSRVVLLGNFGFNGAILQRHFRACVRRLIFERERFARHLPISRKEQLAVTAIERELAAIGQAQVNGEVPLAQVRGQQERLKTCHAQQNILHGQLVAPLGTVGGAACGQLEGPRKPLGVVHADRKLTHGISFARHGVCESEEQNTPSV